MLSVQFYSEGDTFLTRNGPDVQIGPKILVHRGYFSQYRVQDQSEVLRFGTFSIFSGVNNFVS